MTSGKYVQYGCGWCAPLSWINFDASPTLSFERIPLISFLYTKNDERFPKNVEFGDIVKGLPVLKGSCKAVYCSHILEHLSFSDFQLALVNTYDLFEKGGVFRFVIPDLEYFIKNYNNNTSHDAAVLFMRDTLLGKETRSRGIKDFITEWLGNSKHLWMWDYKSVAFELEKMGFVDIRRAIFGDSNDRMFDDVEEKTRWNNALGIECKK